MKDRHRSWAVFVAAILFLGGRAAHAENSLTVANGFAGPGQIAEVPLSISTDAPAHGIIMAFEWDENLGAGQNLVPRSGAGEVLGDADIILIDVMPSRMILGVCMDSDNTCEVIPAGQNMEVGIATIRCLGGGGQREESPIRLVDGKYELEEDWPLDNLLLHFGKFVTRNEGLILHDGSLVCMAGIEPGTGSVAFACGDTLGPDGQPTDPEASPGDRVQVNFYYRAPGLGFSDHRDQIQGLSMAVTHDCDLLAIDEGFSITGTVLEEVGAEFVNIDYGRDGGDGCEFILGVLIDAEAPFDGRTFPATDQFRRLFSQDFEVEAEAPAGECLAIDFTDGIEGNGNVPTKNLVSINFEASSPDLSNCSVCIREGDGGVAEFARGDCNFSTTSGTPVDIADAAAMVGFFFLEGDRGFDAPCEDACDSNDDGNLNVADIVFTLEYLFVAGSPPPPAPGPLEPGIDPTPDELTCSGGQ